MNAEFNWWLLIVGLVIGAGLVWFVLLDSRRREDEIGEAERAVEAARLSAALADEGIVVNPPVVERLLRLHAAYLASSEPPWPDDRDVPPDEPPRRVVAQRPPLMTGGAPSEEPPMSTRETPNVASPVTSCSAATSPIQ